MTAIPGLLTLVSLLMGGCLLAPPRPPRAAPPLALQSPWRKHVLAGVMAERKIAWVGNDLVAFHGAPVGPSSRTNLYLWDLKGGARTLLSRSVTSCVVGNTIQANRIVGPNGEREWLSLTAPDFRPRPLRRAALQGPQFFEPHSCTLQPTPPRLINSYWEALRNGDGFLEFGPRDNTAHQAHVVYHWDSQFKQRRDTGIRVDLPILSMATYTAHANSYLVYDFNLSPDDRQRWLNTKSLRIWRLNPRFIGQPLQVPAGPWVDPIGGTLSFLEPRTGLLITSNNFGRRGEAGGAGGAGIYLLRPGAAPLRLERGLAQEAALSPNGCRLAYSFSPRLDTSIAEGGPRLVVVDLCPGPTAAAGH